MVVRRGSTVSLKRSAAVNIIISILVAIVTIVIIITDFFNIICNLQYVMCFVFQGHTKSWGSIENLLTPCYSKGEPSGSEHWMYQSAHGHCTLIDFLLCTFFTYYKLLVIDGSVEWLSWSLIHFTNCLSSGRHHCHHCHLSPVCCYCRSTVQLHNSPTVSPFKLYHFLCSIATLQTIPLPVSSTRNCTVLLIRVSSVSSCITVVNSYHFCN